VPVAVLVVEVVVVGVVVVGVVDVVLVVLVVAVEPVPAVVREVEPLELVDAGALPWWRLARKIAPPPTTTPATRMQAIGCRLHGSLGFEFWTSTPLTVEIELQAPIPRHTKPTTPILPARRIACTARLPCDAGDCRGPRPCESVARPPQGETLRCWPGRAACPRASEA
jgi:hypothetical protein